MPREIKYNETQMSSKVINPKTKRLVKFGNIVTRYGEIRKQFRDVLFIGPNDKLMISDVIAVDQTTNDVIKLTFTDGETLTEPFNKISPKKIKIGKTINNYKIMTNIPSDVKVNVAFTLIYNKLYSSKKNTYPHKEVITGLFSPTQLNDEDFLRDYIINVLNEEPANIGADDSGIIDINVSNILTKNNKTLKLENMVLREQVPLKLNHVYNEEIKVTNGHCIRDYMKNTYKKHSKTIGDINTVNDIYEWCVKYRVLMKAFDISGNIIKVHYPKKKQRLKNMVFIAYNNHMYPLKNPTLHKHKATISVVKIIDNVQNSLVKLLQTGYLPKYVNLNKTDIMYYSVMDDIDGIKTEVIYSENTEYKKCYSILESFGIADQITPSTNLLTVGGMIENLYNHDSIDVSSTEDPNTKQTVLRKINSQSYMPVGTSKAKTAYVYKNDNFDYNQETVTTDINKAHTNMLMNLPKLPVIDIRFNMPKKITTQNYIINPKYKYIVSVPERNIIIDNNGEFYGSQLLLAKKNNIKFTLLEEIPVQYVNNYFKQMITDMYEKIPNKKDAKNIINFIIGKMEYKTEEYTKIKYNKIMNKDEQQTSDDYNFELTKDYSIECKSSTVYNTYTRKPIADLIKDNLRSELFNFINDNNIRKEDILQIKTDSITFAPKSNKYQEYINNELDVLTGWKYEELKSINKPVVILKEIPSFFYQNTGDSILITGYAGCGKTYEIINNIIPSLKESYRVITPSHKSLEEYMINNLVGSVIQKYVYTHELPEEHNIIVDEIGMVDRHGWDILYQCKLAGKKIFAYGDFRQLKPVKEQFAFDNPNFLNMIFNKQLTNNNNYRNDFTHDYYDSLRTNPKKMRESEVKKYNTPYEDAEIIIAYLNSTRQKYNELMCEKYGITSKFDIGVKVICKTNKLHDYNISNNTILTVKDIDDEDVTLVSKRGIEYTVPLKKYKLTSYFNYGYAVTLHGIQGDTLESFHFCEEDIERLTGEALYTLISRLKKIVK